MNSELKLKIDWTFLFLLICPIFYVVNMDLRSTQTAFFQFAAIFLVGFMHVNRYVGYFLILCAIQSIFMKEVSRESMLNVFFACVIYQFIVKASRPEEIRKYMGVFLGVLALNIFWCLRQKFNIDPIFSMMNYDKQQVISEPSGFFALPAMLGNFSAVVLPFCLMNGFLGYIFIPLVIAGLIFSKSTFSVLAAFLSLLVFFWFRKRIVFWGVLLVSIIFSSFYIIKFDLPEGQYFRRARAWALVEHQAFAKPVVGYGIGSLAYHLFVEVTPSHNNYYIRTADQFKSILVKETEDHGKPDLSKWISENFERANSKSVQGEMQKNNMDFLIWNPLHNEYLQAFFETGLIGVILIGLYIRDIFKRFWDFGRKNLVVISLFASFCSILLISFGHFPFHVARLAGPFLSIMALLELALISCKKQTETQWA